MTDAPFEEFPRPAAEPLEGTATDDRQPLGEPRRGLTIGFVPGIMPGKWFDRWDDRFGRTVPLTRLALTEGTGMAALEERQAHMVLVRSWAETDVVDPERFHAVHLYDEKPVVVLPVDHVLTLLDEVPLDELLDERMLQDPSTIPEWEHARRERHGAEDWPLPRMRDTGDAVELVAGGLGLLIVPMSVARHHHRKDLTYRIVDGIPERSVSLVWPKPSDDERSEDNEAILQEFVGVTRGRKSSSSRGGAETRPRGAQASGKNAQRPAPVRGKPGRAGSSGRATSSKNRSSRSPRPKPKGKKK